MQAGRDAADPGLRRVRRHRRHELVAAAPVAQPHRPDVPVVRPRAQELRERQLVRRARRPLHGPLAAATSSARPAGRTIHARRRPGRGTCSRCRGTRPAPGRGPGGPPPAAGRSGTRRRSRPPGPGRPTPAPSRRRPPDGPGQGPAERELVGRRHQDRPAVGEECQLPCVRAPFVEGEERGAQARPGQDVRVDPQAVRLHGRVPHPALPQRLAEQRQAVGEPGTDHDPLGPGVHARARARYSASAVRSSGRPRGSPYPKASSGRR